MTSRLDRLLILLDTGSSTSVRTTAAKQLAQLAAKSVRSDVGTSDDVVKHRQASLVDQSQWAELMSVVARVLPYLHSRSHDTRTAASVALSQICTLVPLWEPSAPQEDCKPSVPLQEPEFPSFSVQQLMESGSLLLASSGKEFIRPNGIYANAAEVQKARKAAMGRLGLDFLDDVGAGGDDMDWGKEFTAADAEVDVDVKMEESIKQEPDRDTKNIVSPDELSIVKKAESPSSRAHSATPTASDDMSRLSAREKNRLKRKRKPGNSAFVAGPSPPQNSGSKFNATPAGPSGTKARLVVSSGQSPKSNLDDSKQSPIESSSERVVIDPSKGGAVDPKAAAAQQSKALEVKPGQWIWDGVVKILEVDLFSAAWEVRHGAAMALRELLKVQGRCGGMRAGASAEENEISHESWCNHLAAKFLCIFVLDRFGDFVSDQVVAPVRETTSQTLASLLLHMPRRSVLHVHSILLQMIKQNFVLSPATMAGGKFKGAKNGIHKGNGKQHVWEIRHAGLLGIKYEVAVRSDLVTDTVKDEGGEHLTGEDVLRGIVDAAVLGLGDSDDDVRSVAASCLLPITAQLVDHLPYDLPRVLAVLWSCLRDMKDDLSSSVGAVMDLLGKLVSYSRVIEILANTETSLPLTTLAPTLFPFFRHTILTVRLAVVNTLHSFLTVPTLPRDWITEPFLRLLIQNLIVEERADIRDATLNIWRTSLSVLRSVEGWIETVFTPQLVLEWYTLAMTPLGIPIDPSTLYHPSLGIDTHGAAPERHNVDKSMLAQDLGLVSVETVLKARVAAATALACLNAEWPSQGKSLDDMFRPMLDHYIQSPSMLQKFLAAVIVEEWSRRFDELQLQNRPPEVSKTCLADVSSLASDLGQKMLAWLQGEPPVSYHEMTISLSRIFAECTALLQSFVHDCKMPQSLIPSLGASIDINGTEEGCFSITTASSVVGPIFTQLKDNLGRTKKKEVAAIQEKKLKVSAIISHYYDVKSQHDVRVSAAFAAAFVALKLSPGKVSPIVKGIMNGVKTEENVDLQTRSASAVASFIDFCTQNKVTQPPEKIVKNLCTFLCQDAEQTPTFAYTHKTEGGILSFKANMNSSTLANGKGGPNQVEDTTQTEKAKARLCRRGAQIAFVQLNLNFGPRLFDLIPKMWEFIAGGLLTAYGSDSPHEADKLMERHAGQDVIDSLSVLQVTATTLHADLWPRLAELLPKLTLALRSRFAIIRQCTARCFATLCNVITVQAMRHVIEHVVPLLGDSVTVNNRQGAVELIYHVVQELDMKALPYVVFLIVPVLGRMSDPDDDTRATATNTFASLVKMVPLEAGLPDPPEFSEELLQRRDAERQFLTQLLDGSKVEQYTIPVPIKAELRKYQQEGVNWLAFLAKYQLHGILCDDMGLGKTLQAICILSSKYHERAERFKATQSPDSTHLPSLIICPPTLTGHWYYEILKYADNLKPVLYIGNARERNRLLPKISSYDVVITSYEVVRNDISNLQAYHWHYCILDEGHIIKNAKTKLTKAVKCIRAHHRLILSGTPIQNNVLELWSLFDFLMPGFLGTEHSFNERFGKPILSNRDGKSKNDEAAALALEALHKQVLPFLLRRLKEDVLNDLPPKIIQDYYSELSELQKYLYDDFGKSQARHTVEDTLQSGTSEKAAGGGQKHVFQSLQYLRKLCNHPALVLKNDAQAIEAVLEKVQQKGDTEGLHDIQHAPKLLALRQLLMDCGIGTAPTVTADTNKSELLETDQPTSGVFSQHRVLIFCQLKQMLDIIETDLFKRHMPSVTYMRLDGGTDANKRHAIVQTFNADPSIDCLLLTTHVGGLGLTLTGADTVIFVEHDWNPMKDLQAMDRAHRIGQKKVVNVYRLITKGTLEEKIMGLQRFKLNIANSVITQQNSGLASMDTDLVLDLFKRTTEEEDAVIAKKKKEKEKVGPTSQKNILEGLEDLPAEEEYENLNLSSFMGSLGR